MSADVCGQEIGAKQDKMQCGPHQEALRTEDLSPVSSPLGAYCPDLHSTCNPTASFAAGAFAKEAPSCDVALSYQIQNRPRKAKYSLPGFGEEAD